MLVLLVNPNGNCKHNVNLARGETTAAAASQSLLAEKPEAQTAIIGSQRCSVVCCSE